MINTTIGKYKITRLIGEGGMASVYEAEHEMLGTKVAIKVLNPMLSANAQIKERFRNEAKLMASLDHPNITKMIDFDEQPQQLSIVIEYLNGEDLNQNIKRNGPLSEKEIKDVFSQTLSAFQYAHEKGIVHRDIKPSNIFILPNGHVKILDFGIAKLFGQGNEMTHTGTQMGTPIYMSPEQVKADKSIDHRSDIYSLGVTLFFVINGKPPYNSDTDSQFDIFNKIVYEPLPEFSIQSKFKDIVLKACQKNREFRYQGCDDILSELNLKGIIKSDEKTIVNNTSKSHLQHDKTVLAKRSINNYDNQSAHPKKKPPRLNSRRKVILAIIFLVITVSGGMLGMVYQDFLSNQAQEIDIPDANFKAYLVGNTAINTNGDDEIQVSEANAFSGVINCQGDRGRQSENISDLTGIEAFTALTELDCSQNQLTSIDVSKNTALTKLYCSENELTSLDFSKNTALTKLDCSQNQLTSLDVSKNTALTSLWCDDNQLTSLDVSKNTALTDLNCKSNKLTSLDVSKNTALTELDCSSFYECNELTSLDVSKNTALTKLDCSQNKLTSLDVSKNTALTELDCGNFTDLLGWNQITSLDVSKNTALTRLVCNSNKLTSLDVSKNTDLTELWCGGNQLTSLDVSKNTDLTELSCGNDNLTSLDVSKNTALTYLGCSQSQLTSLDVSKNTALTDLNCRSNKLTSLDVSKNTALTRLWCDNNQLTSLDVSKNYALTDLICGGNQFDCVLIGH